MNGAHSIRSRGTRCRRSVTENAAIPSANHRNTRSCEVGNPTVKTIAADARRYVAGAQNRSPLRGLIGASSHARCFASAASGHQRGRRSASQAAAARPRRGPEYTRRGVTALPTAPRGRRHRLGRPEGAPAARRPSAPRAARAVEGACRCRVRPGRPPRRDVPSGRLPGRPARRAGGGSRRHRQPPRRDRGPAARGAARAAVRVRRPGAPRLAVLPELRAVARPARGGAGGRVRRDRDRARPEELMDKRRDAVAAADRTCPRCGSSREADQRYCLECGLALPRVDGRLPALRRRWLRLIGWYPGDWVWVSLLMLVVAAAGAASAIAVSERRDSGNGTFNAAATVRVREP